MDCSPEWVARFWGHVALPEGVDPTVSREVRSCWEWTASTRKDGYGQVWQGKALLSAHRVAYELRNGPLPEGYVLRHTCDNPRCCNPNHLVAGTHEANMRDMKVRARNRFGNSRQKSGREISL